MNKAKSYKGHQMTSLVLSRVAKRTIFVLKRVGLGLKASVAHLVSTQIFVECPNLSTFGLKYRDDRSNIWVKSSWNRPKKRRL